MISLLDEKLSQFFLVSLHINSVFRLYLHVRLYIALVKQMCKL